MENASKALIIAGAILLSILIIAIGMYIYNSSQNSIYQAADQISTQERDAFNSQWTTYEENQPGTNVKALLGKVISNAKTNQDEQTKLLQLAYIASATQDAVESVGSYVPGSTSDTENKGINISGFNLCRTAIESRHTYYVQLRYSETTALVDGIAICYERDQLDTVLEAVPVQLEEK